MRKYRDYRELIDNIEKEANAPLCACYDYDPTPTAEERLKAIRNMIKIFQQN